MPSEERNCDNCEYGRTDTCIAPNDAPDCDGVYEFGAWQPREKVK